MLIEKYTLHTEKRLFLPDAIPLRTPFVLYIDPANICNFECKFCPMGNRKKLKDSFTPGGLMSFAGFRKIVDDLKEFPDKIKLINMWKDGEPLLNPDYADMCRYLVESGVAEKVKIRTNGSLLNPEWNRKLTESGVSEIGISVEAVTEEKYQELTGRKVDYEKLKDMVAQLHASRKDGCVIYVKIIDFGLSDEEKQKFTDDFLAISDICAIEHPMGWSGNSGIDFTLGQGGTKSMEGCDLIQKDICTFPFTTLAVNSDSSVTTCSVDWSRSNIVGNLKEESLRDVWNGEKLKTLRLALLNRQANRYKACGSCEFFKSFPDVLDGHEEQIISNLTRSHDA